MFLFLLPANRASVRVCVRLGGCLKACGKIQQLAKAKAKLLAHETKLLPMPVVTKQRGKAPGLS